MHWNTLKRIGSRCRKGSSAANSAEIRAEVNGAEIITTAEDSEEEAVSTALEGALWEYKWPCITTGEQRKALVTAVSAFVGTPAVY